MYRSLRPLALATLLGWGCSPAYLNQMPESIIEYHLSPAASDTYEKYIREFPQYPEGQKELLECFRKVDDGDRIINFREMQEILNALREKKQNKTQTPIQRAPTFSTNFNFFS